MRAYNYRYVDKDTAIHKLNPFPKMAWVTSILILSLIFNHPIYLLLLFLSTLLMVFAAKIFYEWKAFMKFVLWIGLMILIMNIVVSHHGEHVLYKAPLKMPIMGNPKITLEAFAFGVGMCLRILTIISAFTIFNFTVHPDDLMLASIKLKIPYKSVLVTSVSTRFIPTLMDDLETITDVQRSRGLELDKGKLLDRIKNRLPILIPLLSNSMDRAIQLAESMESRGFGSGKGRTFYKDISFNKFDYFLSVSGISPLIIGVYIRWAGYGNYQYYPRLDPILVSKGEFSILLCLAFLLSMVILLPFLRGRVFLD